MFIALSFDGVFFFGVIMKAQKLIEKLGKAKISDILKEAHPDAVYYVDEWNEHFKVHGYCADKCIVGINNPHTHYKLTDLQEALG